MSDDGVCCIGCFRTMDEIAGWTGFDDDRRRLVLEQVRRRRALAAAGVLAMSACAAPPPQPAPPWAPAAAAATAPAAAAPATVPRPTPVLPHAGPAQRPSLGLFSDIKAPGNVEPVLELAASGDQIFRCEDVGGATHWAFRLPEAELRDSSGQVVAHHGADYSFEHIDGSHLLGTIVGYDSSPDPGALRWLLLHTRSFGQGVFASVSYVQRIDTQGGMPPAGCTPDQLNQILRVPFTARFIFYTPHRDPGTS